MMHCISGLSRHLTRQEHRQYFVQWCQKFAVEKAIDDTAFAKAVLSGWLGLVRTVRSRDAEFDAVSCLFVSAFNVDVLELTVLFLAWFFGRWCSCLYGCS